MGAEVASAWVTLIPSTKGWGRQIERQTSGELDKAGKDGGKKFGEGFKGSAGTVLKGFAAVAVGGAVGGFLKDAIGQASDLNETMSAVDVVFGSASKSVKDFAADSRKNILLTKQEALSAAQTFGTFGKAAGLEGPELSKFSTGLVGLASDLSSFKNTSTDQAVEALGAALRGESEPMRAYGVLLDEATIKAEAMSIGILKPTKNLALIKDAQTKAGLAQKAYNKAVDEHGPKSEEAQRASLALAAAQRALAKETKGLSGNLTPQQKILAAQSAIFKQTSDAQGDAQRTSKGYANQMRILNKQATDFKVSVGNQLLPVVTSFAGFLNSDVVPALKSTSSFVKNNQTTLKVLTGVVLVLTAATMAHSAVMAVNEAGGMAKWLKGAKLVTVATKVWTATQWLLNLAMSANPIGLIIVGVAALAVGLAFAWKKSETFRNVVIGAFQAVSGAVLGVVGGLLKGVRAFAQVSDKVFGTNFTPTIDKAIGAVEALNYKIQHLNDKHIRVTADVVYKAPKSGGLKASAGGNFLRAGEPSIIGERGWEYWVPQQPGYVVNQQQAAAAAASGSARPGAGGGFHLTVHNPVPEPVSSTAAKAREVAYLLDA